MHEKDMKDSNYNTDNIMESVNEPEEGEIVDDYELISSDEEICMRQRILELEAENEEIEQIAVISRSYDLDRAARIPTDVSSISSTEFKTPKKRKRHKNKDHKKKSCHHHHSHHRHHGAATSQHLDKKISRTRKTRCKRREKLLKKKHDKYGDKLALESNDSLNSSLSSSSLTDSDDGSTRLVPGEEIRDEDDYYHKPGIRDTLRLAVARHRKNSFRQNTTHKNGLKEKLMRRDVAFTGNLFSLPNGVSEVDEINDVDDDDDDAVEICEPVIHSIPDDSSDSLEEKELRLIALKSAVMKKHMDRKRRNAEAAYSPTDFDEMMMNEDKLADIEVVDLEEDDSQNACGTASPIASPQLMLLDGQDDSSQMVDCKPVDMDIANSDSEDASANTWHIKMPSDIPFPPFPPKDNPFSYGGSLFMSEFPANSTNPPPPGVDDYEETKQPLMNFGKFQDIESHDMELDNEDFEPIVSYPRSTQNADKITVPEFKVNSNSASLHSNPNDEDLQEEEELALRALLLSKFQSPKNQKKCSAIETKENLDENKTNLETCGRVVKPTEAILKEAVKRLQIHSQVDCRREETQQQDENSNGIPLVLDNHQHQLSDSRNGECFHDIPLPWNHQNQIKIEGDSVTATSQSRDHQRQECVPPYPLETKEHSEELPIVALVSLQRKAKELKTHSETKELDRPQGANGTVCEDKSVDGVAMKREPNELDPIETMDEDNKRRLQKLKDDILFATRRKEVHIELENTVQNSEIIQTEFETNTRPPSEEIVVEKTVREMTITVKPDCELFESYNVNGQSFEKRLETPKATTKVHLDVNKTLNTSTHKVTSSHSTPKHGELPKDKTALKENNVNSVNKKSHKPNTDIPANIKIGPEPAKKVIKTSNRTVSLAKTKEPKVTQSKPLTTSVVATTLPVKAATVNVNPTLSTYSVMRTTKIVKPNKVINRNVDTKRKVILINSDQVTPPAKLMKSEPPSTAVTAKAVDDSSRLITSMDQVKHMCNVAQLVISVQNSSNESSDEEWANCHSMYRPLADYNDIASPLSLNLESPCLTPLRSNSPVDAAINKEKTFEEKANHMFKAKRSLVNVKPPEKTVSPKTPALVTIQKSAQNLKTPVAVRHLPAAAQDEYRKLVHRMKLLENQRTKKETSSTNDEKTNTTAIDTKVENDSGIKPSLVRQVLLRNANNKPSTGSVAAKASTEPPLSPKANRANVLRSYESLYVKIGAGIVNNLDKSLRLVEDAKKAKINKLKLESRLKELKAEMELLQTKHKEEDEKISRIYPTICTTNEVITSLKQKRSRVFKAALNLGKSLKGDDYRLNNDLKQNITSKTKQLASEIKLVNSLKATNINKEVHEVSPSPLTDRETTEQKKFESSCLEETTKSTAINSPEKAQSEENKSNVSEEDLTPETAPQIGGNTEFQDTAPSSDTHASEYETNGKLLTEPETMEGYKEAADDDDDESADKNNGKPLTSYISPLEHLRNIDGAMDPNGVICPYDLMGNCEDASCKYVHISQQDKSQTKPS